MGAFTNLDDYVNRMTGGNSGAPENLYFNKHLSFSGGTLATALAFIQEIASMWRWDGIPNAGATAAAVAICDKTTTGALQFTNSAGSAVKRLVQASTASVGDDATQVFVMDRLLAKGGLSATNTGAQNVQSGSGVVLTRYTGGTGNQIWVEIQTAVTGAATTITASYTNESGVAGRTTQVRRFGAAPYSDLHGAIQLPLQNGDKGVQSVETVTVLASTGVAGDFAVVIYHPITLLLGKMTPQGPFGTLGGLPELVDDACITFMQFQGSSELTITGILSTVDV